MQISTDLSHRDVQLFNKLRHTISVRKGLNIRLEDLAEELNKKVQIVSLLERSAAMDLKKIKAINEYVEAVERLTDKRNNNYEN